MLRTVVTLAAIVAAGTLSSAQVENPVRWSAALTTRSPVEAGSRIAVTLTATIAPGWHVYSTTQPPGGPVATRVTLPNGQPFSLDAPVDGPRPRLAFDPNFSMETELYDQNVAFTVPVAVAAKTRSGTYPLDVHVYFQACDEHFCLPPRTERLTVQVEVKASRTTLAATALKPGEKAGLTIRWMIEDGYYLDEKTTSSLVFTAPLGISITPSKQQTSGRLIGVSEQSASVTVGRGVAPGVHRVKVEAVIYFCSLREQWCKRITRTMELPIEVSRNAAPGPKALEFEIPVPLDDER